MFSAPLATGAQQGKAYRIGYVGNSSPSLGLTIPPPLLFRADPRRAGRLGLDS